MKGWRNANGVKLYILSIVQRGRGFTIIEMYRMNTLTYKYMYMYIMNRCVEGEFHERTVRFRQLRDFPRGIS